jgi:putative aminopeptidase FrvX
VLTARGLPSVVLSCGMTDVHSTQECVAVTDLDAMVRVLLAAIDEAVSS